MKSRLVAPACLLLLVSACAAPSNVGSGAAPHTGEVRGKITLTGETSSHGVTVILSGPSSRAAITLDDGVYDFPEIEGGTYVVTASAPDTEPAAVSTSITVAESGGPTSVKELSLTPLGGVSGAVTFGSATGNAGIMVIASGAASVAMTDDAGHFTLTHVPTGARTLTAAAQGYTSATISDVVVKYATVVDAPAATLTKGSSTGTGRITGSVLLTGEAKQAGIVVSLTGPVSNSALTSDTGAYTFSGLPEGTYVVTAAARSTAEGVLSTSVTVSTGQAPAGELAFTPLGTLVGKAQVGAATGNAGILVSVPGTQAVSVTEDDGSFTLRNVPTGARVVVASRPGYSNATSSTVQVKYDQTVTLASTIQLGAASTPGATVIAGKALLLGKADMSGTTVSIDGTNTSVQTQGDGSFAIANPPGGLFSLTFSNGAYSETLQNVLSLPGSRGQIVAGALYPIGNLDVPAGQRFLQGLYGSTLPSLTYSKNGQVAWYSSASSSQLVVVDLTSGVRRAVVSTTASNVALTPDGSRLVYATNPNPSQSLKTLWSVSSTGGAPTQIASGVLLVGPVSDDSGKILFITQGLGPVYTLSTVSVAGGPITSLAQLALGDFSSSGSWNGTWQWSPGGQYVIVSNGGFIQSVQSSNGTANTLVPYTQYNAYVYPSPNNTHVAIRSYKGSSKYDINVFPLIGGAAIGTLTDTYNDIEGFSPDGNTVVLSDSPSLFAWPITGGTPVVVGKYDYYASTNYRFTSDGTGVVSMASDIVYYSPVTGGTLSTVGGLSSAAPYYVYGQFDLSPDGRTIYYVSGDGSYLAAYDIQTTSPRLVTDQLSLDSGSKSFAMSPDGKKILFEMNDLDVGRTLASVPAIGGTVTPLLRVYDAFMSQARWVNNGLAIMLRDGTPEPYSFQDGLYAIDVK